MVGDDTGRGRVAAEKTAVELAVGVGVVGDIAVVSPSANSADSTVQWGDEDDGKPPRVPETLAPLPFLSSEFTEEERALSDDTCLAPPHRYWC